jgi:hypothetical protein
MHCDQTFKKLNFIILGIIFIVSIIMMGKYSPYIMDYDGLMYFNFAKSVNSWLFIGGNNRFWIDLAENSTKYWPISNGIAVYFAAIFLNVVSANYVPIIFNSLCFFIFLIYISKIKSQKYILISSFLIFSNLLLFRISNTLTTEFSVGIWMFSFLVALDSNAKNRYLYLVILAILGLLSRTIDIVFILMSTASYTAIHYIQFKDRRRLIETVKSIGLTLLITAPLFYNNYRVAYDYVYQTSFGWTAESWKSLAGVSDRYDVLKQYFKSIYLYNHFIFPILFVSLFFNIVRNRKEILKKLAVFGAAVSICVPLLVASSLNIQVVFWVYVCIVFVIAENINIILEKESSKKKSYRCDIFRIYLFLFSVLFLFYVVKSWNYESSYLNRQKVISETAIQINKMLSLEPGGAVVSSNYRGVGPLDLIGLAFYNSDQYTYGGIEDIYSKNKTPVDYIKLKSDNNFFIAARENYFFAPHFGINHHIKEIYELFDQNSAGLGYKKIAELSNQGRYFDIWYKPGAHGYPLMSDKWISRYLPLAIGTQKLCGADSVSGTINLSLNFPNPYSSDFKPPFRLTIQAKDSEKILARTVVDHYGATDIAMDVKNVKCGEYQLSIDKFFTTQSDPRELSAQFVKLDGIFRFDAPSNFTP